MEALGTPDRDDTTAYDTPRPLIVTRIVEYRQEAVKIVFIPANATVKTPPPYLDWHVMGYIDMMSNQAISADRATGRLRSRVKR
jgi:hypothetical protein